MNQAIAIRIIKKLTSRESGGRVKLSADQVFFTGEAGFPNDIPPHVRFVGFITKEKHAKRNFAIELAVDIAGTVAKGITPTPGVESAAGALSQGVGATGDTASTLRNRTLGGAYQTGLKFITPSGDDDREQFAHNRSFLSSQKWANNVGKYFLLYCCDQYVECATDYDYQLYEHWRNLLSKPDLHPAMERYPVVNLGGAQTLTLNIKGVAVPIEE